MTKNYHLTPGPSELYFTVPDHIQMALKNNVASISHRSQAFKDIYAHTEKEVRKLLSIPEDYFMVFTSSANEIWERLLQNCTSESSFHLVNGSFSKKFYDFSTQLGRNAQKVEAPFGEGFKTDEIEFPSDVEMICLTQNETSSGVQLPVEEIYKVRERNQEALIVLDAVSAVPYVDLDLTKIDSLYFSVQKGMGLPAGLGVWVFNQRCVDKCNQLMEAGQKVGTYHSIPALLKQAENNMTPETPNVLNIYLLGKVAEDMNRRGVDMIRGEMDYKSTMTYGLLDRHPNFKPIVDNKDHRSKTVIVTEVIGKEPSEVIDYLKKEGLIIGTGYGKYKANQVRIANFPTHSKEIYFKLNDLLESLK
ncbi:aminotransferase class V-fold PLP-dependent enzyme [Sediminitomix flava]|uniref:phosphoserine transaminase n=1 Tax=Sediminitomix flava TaxID=379075 RepID=A0A315ZFH3_SEDFL|nr:aminotransferase class V-fold PLP-dependent enzyme [Sediminitomix flava]PWJ43900.1 phosphoserine aminotransferase [Sediminitomix flava]